MEAAATLRARNLRRAVFNAWRSTARRGTVLRRQCENVQHTVETSLVRRALSTWSVLFRRQSYLRACEEKGQTARAARIQRLALRAWRHFVRYDHSKFKV
jgi:hypothetical protein